MSNVCHTQCSMNQESKTDISSLRKDQPKTAIVDRVYQMNFSCEQVGRYFSKNKRRITWNFGFTNINALQNGHRGHNCRGEEHVVQLLWSLRSRKAKLFWNEIDITNHFTDVCRTDDMVHFAWKTPAGETLQVVAHADETKGQKQYELYVDGASFSLFSTIAELGGPILPSPMGALGPEPERITKDQEMIELTLDESEAISSKKLSGFGLPGDETNFRLSMVGLKTTSKCGILDELHSELYSPMLEELRKHVTEFLPQLEDIVSRAIINAFFVDTDSQDGMCSIMPKKSSQSQMEVKYLWDAYEKVRIRSPSNEGFRLSFMQQMIDSLFVLLRNEVIQSEQAFRIILSVSCFLRFKLAISIPSDTVVFADLNETTTTDDLFNHVRSYGVVESVAIADGRGFGFCRFEDEASALLVYDVARQKHFTIQRTCPTPFLLGAILCGKQTSKSRMTVEETSTSETEASESSSLTLLNPHLMAPMGLDFAFNHSYCNSQKAVAKKQSSCASEKTYSLSSGTNSGIDQSNIMISL